MMQQIGRIFRVLLGIGAISVVGYQSLIVRLDYGFAGYMAPFCLLVVGMLMLDMFFSRDKSGATWYKRYGDTSGVLTAQLAVGVGSFWCASADMIEIFVKYGCGPCADWSLDKLDIKTFFRTIYYIHIIPCFLIGVLGPLQFYEPIRKFNRFFVHRWIGRLLLTGAIIQQFTASVMITMYLVKGKSTLDRVYHASLAALNVYAWIAIIVGWRAAVRKDIPTHGGFMHRLGAAWSAVVVGYRILQAPLALLFGDNDMAGAVAGWLIDFIFIGTVELYLWKAGRFPAPQPDPARCPFTGEQGECRVEGEQVEQ